MKRRRQRAEAPPSSILSSRAWPSVGTLVSVVLTVASFPPLEFSHLIWVALVPWLHVVTHAASIRDAIIQGFWMGFLAGGLATFWIVPAVPHYLGVGPIVGLGLHALYALVGQLQFVAFAPLLHWASKSAKGLVTWRIVVFAALAYVGLDWARPNLLQDTLGLPLNAYRDLIQVVDLGGIRVLTFLVLLVNLGILSLAGPPRDGGGTSRNWIGSIRFSHESAAALLPVALLVISAWLYGSMRYHEVSRMLEAPRRSILAGIVQGSVSNDLKHRWTRGDDEAARQSLDIYISATNELLERAPSRAPDLIVWPETAYPGIFRRPENEAQLRLNIGFDRYITRTNKPFVFGAYDREDRVDRRILRNALFFVSPKPDQPRTQPSAMQVYHKHILFPVGETLPFVSESAMRTLFPRAGAFSSGEGPRIIELDLDTEDPNVGTISMGPTICYEDLFPSHLNALRRLGADVIVNVSNDGWFGDLGEPRLHLILARFASISTRLPQVRVANTGYSALITQNGDMPEVSRYGDTQSLELAVPIVHIEETLATHWGDWFGPASFVLALIGIGAIRFSNA